MLLQSLISVNVSRAEPPRRFGDPSEGLPGGRRARVIGVSPDPVEAISKFAGKYGLDFTLLADPDHAVADLYGTWVEKAMYGKKYMGVQRSTFIIDPEGEIAHVIEKASPKTHDDQVLGLLGEVA